MALVYDPFIDSDGYLKWWAAADGVARQTFVGKAGNLYLNANGMPKPFIALDGSLAFAAVSASVWSLNDNGSTVVCSGVYNALYSVVDLNWAYNRPSTLYAAHYNNAGEFFWGGLTLLSDGKNCGKLDNNGIIQWSKKIGGIITQITTDGSGNIYLTCDYLFPATGASIWKRDSNGDAIWSYNTGGSASDIAVDGLGNVYAVGQKAGGETFWKLNSGGVLQWERHPGSPHVPEVRLSPWLYGITINTSGDIYLCGKQSSDFFDTWKYDSDGNLLWARSTSNVVDANLGVANDSSNNVYITGGLNAANETIRKYDSAGNYVSGAATGGIRTRKVSISGSNEIYVTGARFGTISVWRYNTALVRQWDYDTGGNTYGIYVAV